MNTRAYFDEHLMEMIRTLIEPRTDDIYIVTYPRSGTTWLQMILYQMLTDGEMSFTHISQVIPFFDRALLSRTDLAALKSPRVFKTHLPFRNISTLPGRYLYVARNGKDVLTSYYHFHRSHYGFNRGLAEFFEDFISGTLQYGSWFDHVSEWRKHDGDPRTLFRHFVPFAFSFLYGNGVNHRSRRETGKAAYLPAKADRTTLPHNRRAERQRLP